MNGTSLKFYSHIFICIKIILDQPCNFFSCKEKEKEKKSKKKEKKSRDLNIRGLCMFV